MVKPADPRQRVETNRATRAAPCKRDTVRDGRTAPRDRRRTDVRQDRRRDSRTFPPMQSRLSSSTTSRCSSSSHATETPAIPAPMIATDFRGCAACASAGVATVAAIVFSTSRRVQVGFITSSWGANLRATISRAAPDRPVFGAFRRDRERYITFRARARRPVRPYRRHRVEYPSHGHSSLKVATKSLRSARSIMPAPFRNGLQHGR